MANAQITVLTIIRKATDKELVNLLARATKEKGEGAAIIADAIRSEMGMRAAQVYGEKYGRL